MHNEIVRMTPLGDRAVVVDEGPRICFETLQNALPQLVDAVEAFGTLGLYFSGAPPSFETIASALHANPSEPSASKTQEIPICYAHGLDLEAIAESVGRTQDEVMALHAAASYRVEAIGFAPGFPYLSGLPTALSGLSRRASPRASVPAGSIGIVDDLCCIYPDALPAGWHIVGRTPLRIADLSTLRFPIAVGDTIRFRAIDADAFESLQGAPL